MAATTEPKLLVFSKELATPEIAKLEVVALVVVELSILAPPTTSNLAIDEVAVAPMITWLVVVET